MAAADGATTPGGTKLADGATTPGGSFRDGATTPGGTKLWGNQVNQKNLADFFQFLQCQLKMEARERLGMDLVLADPEADKRWDAFQAFVRPNLGKKRKVDAVPHCSWTA